MKRGETLIKGIGKKPFTVNNVM